MTITSWDVRVLIGIYHEIAAITDDFNEAQSWLIEPNEHLDGRRPCECITSPKGLVSVHNAVKRLRGDDEDDS